jgi:tetratricopeptide (TPR) repeat protein
MPNKLSRYADGVMEAAWLAVVVLVPVFFNLYSSRIFEPDKIAILRTLALLVAAAWLVKVLAGGFLFKGPIPHRELAAWKEILKVPLVLPAVGLALVTLIATAFSITPSVSIWGSYPRMQGAYTTLSYLVLFAALLGNLRRSEQVERLITAIIVSSLPVALYGILQRYQLDPIPWGGDVAIRVAANLGNSIFVAAYLIMVFPLTAGRMILAFRSILNNAIPQAPAMIRATLYVFVAMLQVITLYLSGSRGPALGWMAGSFLMVLVLGIYTRRRWLTGSLVAFTVLAIVFLALFNTQGGFFESLRNQPAIGRFGKLLDPESNTALVRKYIWEGAARLVSPHAPLNYPDGSPDAWNFLRPLLGYGPEAMYVAYNPFYPPELAHVERRNATPDRSHNETWDTLVISGLLGLIVYLALFLGVFYSGLNWLGLVPNQRWKNAFWALTLLCGGVGALVLSLLEGIAYGGVGLPLGLLMGIVIYIMLLSLAGPVQAPHTQAEFARAIILLALLSALLAHFVEINFGIAIAVTRTYFWVYAALLVLVGQVLNRSEARSLSEQPANSGSQASATEPGSARKKKKGFTNEKKAGPAAVHTWLSASIWGGFVLALILGAQGYAYLDNAGGENVQLSDLWASLTRLRDAGPGASWAVVGMLLVTLLVSALLMGSENAPPGDPKQWAKVALGSLGLAILPALFYWTWHASSLIAISSVKANTIDDVLQQVERFSILPANFFAYMIGLILLAPLANLLTPGIPQVSSVLPVLAGSASLAVAVLLGVITNLRGIQADVAFKLAEQFAQSRTWPVAIQIYQRAIELAPREDYYYLFSGRAYLEYANTLEDPIQRDRSMELARDDLLAAQQLNPLNTDHTANLARLYNLWASFTDDSEIQSERAHLADHYFALAVQLSPNHARLWGEWSLLHRDHLSDITRSQELLDQALLIDAQYDWTYALYGDLYLRQAAAAPADQATSALEQAVRYYETALANVDARATQSVISYQLALAHVYQQLKRYDEAIDLLYKSAALDVTLEQWRLEEQVARLYLLKGDLAKARYHGEQALALAPQDQQTALQAWLDALGSAP